MAVDYCSFCGCGIPKDDMDKVDGRYTIDIGDTIENESKDGTLCKICYNFVRQMLR